MNKRILFLTNMFPSKENPSYGVFVKKTYEWLCACYDVKLIKIIKHNNIVVKLFSYIMFYMISIFNGVFGKYDCIYAHYISHSAIPIKIIKMFNKGIIVIGNIHGEDVFATQKKYEKNPKRAKVFLKYADYIISPSNYYKDRLSSEYNYKKDKIFVSPSGGVDKKVFCPCNEKTSKKELGLSENTKYIGFVSRIEEGKGWDVFLKAINNLCYDPWYDNYKFIIVGSGKQEKELEKIMDIFQIRDRIIRFPLLPQNQLKYVYNSLEVFCFTTCLENESLGLVGIEALACGTLSVLSDVPGVLTYANDTENCYIYRHASANDLEEKIRDLVSLPSYKKIDLKNSAVKSIEQFEAENVKRSYYRFFSVALNKR